MTINFINSNSGGVPTLNQREMFLLGVGLAERGIPFDIRSFYDGVQIVCDGWDAICHNGSYGHESGLIEVMGIIDEDDVVGYLTAEAILDWLDENKKY